MSAVVSDKDLVYIAPMKVAGTSFRQQAVSLCKEGMPVRVVPEPENKFDPHAVRVEAEVNKDKLTGCFGDFQSIGYIPKDHVLTVKAAIRLDNFLGVIIGKVGKPPSADRFILGVQLAFLFKDHAPDLYGTMADVLRGASTC